MIGIKETHRLAQQVGSYKVMTYQRKVVKEKGTDNIITPPAPDNVLDGCYADVSLLAGLMVDKAVYHLPLHRQHQRMLDAGVTLSRSTLINYVAKGIELLRPIAKAQLVNMLAGSHLSMDEVPHKVGRTQAKGKAHKQMKQTDYTQTTSRYLLQSYHSAFSTRRKCEGMSSPCEHLQRSNESAVKLP